GIPMAMPPGPAPMTPTRGLRFDITGLVGEITLRKYDGGHTWQCYISSLICKTTSRRWCSTALRSRVDEVNYRRSITGLVVIDPYNDFISEGGKVWDRLKGVAEANGCVGHMGHVLDAARKADIQVFYALHTGPATTRSGNTLRRSRRQRGRARPSRKVRGAAGCAVSLNPGRATLSPKSIGAPVALLTLI